MDTFGAWSSIVPIIAHFTNSRGSHRDVTRIREGPHTSRVKMYCVMVPFLYGFNVMFTTNISGKPRRKVREVYHLFFFGIDDDIESEV